MLLRPRQGSTLKSTLQRLTDVPHPVGWLGPRFLLYARSLHTLSVKALEGHHDMVDLAVLHAWTGYLADHKVFPMLHKLSVEWAAEVGSALVLGLASPSLQTIHLEFKRSYEKASPDIHSMLQGLVDVSPNVCHLALSQSSRHEVSLGGYLPAAIL